MMQFQLTLVLILVFFSFAQNAFTQENEIYGIVTDFDNTPLPGVNITVEGSERGTTTDFEGKYKIKVDTGEKLKFRVIGFEEQTKVIDDGMTSFDLKMKEGASELDEVVVVGYGEQKKINLTGAVSEVSSKDFANRPITDLAEGIQGKVSSLRVSPGKSPGEGASFNVRGMTSINGGQPLVLVDGVEQDPDLLNPSDIENISVLKDGASTAIYGSRAAYGVVLITTKSGEKEESPQIQINSSYAIRDLTRHPKYVNSMDYIDYMDMASHNAGQGDFIEDRIRKGAEAYYENPDDNPYVLYDPDIDKEGYYKYVANEDWEKAVYKKGSLLKNNVSLSGGSESTSYYFSYSNLIEKGFLKPFDDGLKRHNVNLNIDTDVNDWLNAFANVGYSYRTDKHPSFGIVKNPLEGLLHDDLSPLMPVRHPDGSFSGQGTATNPVALASEGGYQHNKNNNLRITGGIEVNPVKGLNLRMDYTMNPQLSERETVHRLYEESHADGNINIYPWTDPNGIDLENNNSYYHVLNLTGTYFKSVDDHNFKALLGYNQEYKKSKFTLAGRDDLIDNDLPAINRATGEKSVDGSNTSWGLLGYFFRFIDLGT